MCSTLLAVHAQITSRKNMHLNAVIHVNSLKMSLKADIFHRGRMLFSPGTLPVPMIKWRA